LKKKMREGGGQALREMLAEAGYTRKSGKEFEI
jgi:hypothetical protein